MKKKLFISLFCFLTIFFNIAIGETKKEVSQEELNAIYLRVFGKEQQALSLKTSMDLEINNKPNGTIRLQTDTKKITKLQRSILLPKLKRYLKTDIYKKLAKLTAKKTWISTKHLKEADITISYNTMTLNAEVNIDKKNMNRRMRAMLSALHGRHKVIPENLLEPADISGYINLGSNFSYQHDAKENKARFNLHAVSAVNVQGFVLENKLSYQVGGKKNIFRRDYTRLVIDDPENDYRYQLGDIYTQGRNLQTSFRLAGAQLSKETIWTDRRDTRPQGDYHFLLENDAEVEVYQDGNLTKTKRLQAGEHTLSEITNRKGSQTRLVVKDDFGKTYTETFDRFIDNRLLKPKYARYATSAGVLSRYKSSGLEYKTNAKIVSGFYQFGVSENITIGFDAQSYEKSFQLGSDIIWATSIGNISAGVAHSQPEKGKIGQAVQLQISSNQRRKKNANSEPFSWDISAQLYNKNYRNIGDEGNYSDKDEDRSQREHHRLDLNLHHTFSDNLTGNLHLTHTGYHDNRSYQTLGLNLGWKINKSTYISLGSSHNRSRDDKIDHSIYASVNISLGQYFGRHHSFENHYSGQDQSLRSTYRVGSKGRFGLDSLNGALRVQARTNAQAVGGDIRYRDEKFDLTARHIPTINKKTGKVTQRSHAAINTAIAFADGALAISRPISNSFAIITQPKGLKYPMAVSRSKSLFNRRTNDLNDLPKYYDALLTSYSSAVLSNLSDYSIQHISTDSAVLPKGFDHNMTEFDLMPDYKSGYKIKVGGEKGLSFNATLLVSNGNPLKLEGGQLVSQDEYSDEINPILFFTNDKGEIDIPTIKKGAYKVELFNYPEIYMNIINVNEKTNKSDTIYVPLK